MSGRPSISVCAPAYNEARGIEDVVLSWDKILRDSQLKLQIDEYEIVVCDDGSSDNTFSIISNVSANNLVAIKHEVNLGAGCAISSAIRNSKYQYVITIDSDGQFDLAEALAWLPLVEPNMAVLGYRRKNDHILLRLGSKLSTMIISYIHKTNVRDANCMLKVIDGNFIRNIDLRSVGLNYSGEMTHLILQNDLKIMWMPTTHAERQFGKSSSKLLKDGVRRLAFLLYLFMEKKMIDKKIITPRKPR